MAAKFFTKCLVCSSLLSKAGPELQPLEQNNLSAKRKRGGLTRAQHNDVVLLCDLLHVGYLNALGASENKWNGGYQMWFRILLLLRARWGLKKIVVKRIGVCAVEAQASLSQPREAGARGEGQTCGTAEAPIVGS